jgi:hypothetical protein
VQMCQILPRHSGTPTGSGLWPARWQAPRSVGKRLDSGFAATRRPGMTPKGRRNTRLVGRGASLARWWNEKMDTKQFGTPRGMPA